MAKGSSYRFQVLPEEHGLRLWTFLRRRCPQAPSAKFLKRAIEDNRCRVNGNLERFSSYALSAYEQVTLELGGFTSPSEEGTCSVLYEDEDLVICDKPAGLQSDAGIFNTVFPEYKGRLELAHRLDKDTSGLILLTRSKRIQAKIRSLFSNRQIQKYYALFVDGLVQKEQQKEEGKIVSFLSLIRKVEGQSIWGVDPKGKGKEASTYWRCILQGAGASFVICQIFTGRTHQLRVQWSHLGHPILGDYQYASRFLSPIEASRHLLHAYSLRFTHPITHKEVEIQAPLPEDFQQALKYMKEHPPSP